MSKVFIVFPDDNVFAGGDADNLGEVVHLFSTIQKAIDFCKFFFLNCIWYEDEKDNNGKQVMHFSKITEVEVQEDQIVINGIATITGEEDYRIFDCFERKIDFRKDFSDWKPDEIYNHTLEVNWDPDLKLIPAEYGFKANTDWKALGEIVKGTEAYFKGVQLTRHDSIKVIVTFRDTDTIIVKPKEDFRVNEVPISKIILEPYVIKFLW